MATILVVDDSRTNREIAREALDHGGHQVIEASGGRQGLAAAHDEHPDLVVLDMLMPGMDGHEFVHELRSDPNTAAIPVLFYTANYRADEVESIAQTYGVNRVLLKSEDPLELLDAVDEAVHEHPPAPADLPQDGVEPNWEHLRVVNTKLLENVQALDDSNARFVAIAEHSPIGIVVAAPDGRATYVNPHLEEILGTPRAGLLDLGWLRCLHPDHRDTVLADIARHRVIPRHRDLVASPGGDRWLNTLVRAMHDGDGSVRGYIAIIDDVTDVVAAEQRRAAEEHEREVQARRQVTERLESLARLAGGVAHDFNNLLGVVLAYSEFAVDDIHDATGEHLDETRSAALLKSLDRITQAGKRAAHLTHQLLAFGRREIVNATAVDLNAVIHEVHGMISGTIGAHVTISTRLDAAQHHILADDSQLCQVLLNLAVNARDAMPDGGTLELATANPGDDTVHLTVSDTGCGMAPEVVERAIEPFFTTKSRGAGSGLGLATSYGIVNQLGGQLRIQSSPGAGTTVHISLPCTDQPVQPAAPEAAAPAGNHETILVAEDEDGLRDAANRILTKAGYQVLTAVNGRDALAVAQRHPGPIHLLLTDVVMPQLDGRELALQLREQRPETPVLYMSGYAASIMSDQGALEPGVTVLPKPFTETELLKALRAMINRASVDRGSLQRL